MYASLLSQVHHPRSLCYSASTFWALATFPKLRAPLGEAGTIEVCIGACRLALKELDPAFRPVPSITVRQWWSRTSQWAAATVWLLSYDDENAQRALKYTDTLMAMVDGPVDDPVLRHMAVGTLVRMTLLPLTMSKMVGEYRITDVLQRVGNDPTSAPKLRLMCTNALGVMASAPGDATDVARELDQAAGLEVMLVKLARTTGRVGLQTVACRRIALLAMQVGPPPCLRLHPLAQHLLASPAVCGCMQQAARRV